MPIVSEFLRYLKMFRPYAGRRIEALFGLALCGVFLESLGLGLVIPILNHEVLLAESSGVTGRSIRQVLAFLGLPLNLNSLLGILIILFLFKGAFMFCQSWLNASVQTRLEKDLRDLFLQKYANMTYSYYTGVSVGKLNNIITTEIERVLSALNNLIRVGVNTCNISVYVGAAFVLNAPLTGGVLVLGILLYLSLRQFTGKLQTISLKISETNADMQALIIQKIYHFKYLKATGGFRELLPRIFAKTDESRSYKMRALFMSEMVSLLVEPLAVIFLAMLVWYYVILRGQPIGTVLVLLLFFYRSFVRIFTFQDAWQRFHAYSGGLLTVDKVGRELDANREIVQGKQVAFNAVLELCGVDFSYGNRKVLSDVTICIPKNSSIGIVGPSGAGKTTLFDLLAGLITPNAGTMRIDGVDCKEIDLEYMRNRLGYVTQEPVIFNDTVAANISLWSCAVQDVACRERIERAARLAHCHEFVQEMEHGYDSNIGERGVRLSGGQRQRIAIARELFKDPAILIFDEATSALDSESERLIQHSLDAMRGERTVLIIAHRLSSVRRCDCIYVLNNGSVIERGAFEDLLAKDSSVFAKMWEAQQGG